MASQDKNDSREVIATGDLASAQRTIGGILGQLDALGIDRDESVNILLGVGLPALAYDDPGFPISLHQDFELLNEVRQRLPIDISMELSLFWRMLGTRANMFGALGLVWQSAPTMLDAFQALITYPEANWGRSQMILSASEFEERMVYRLDKSLVTLSAAEDVEATHKYALLLDLTAGVAATLDVISDRSLVAGMQIPFAQPHDWPAVANMLEIPVEFEAPEAAVVYKPGFLRHVPRRAHEVSFRLAMKLVGKESALLADDISFRERVVRWLWASSPPLKKGEIAKLLGVSERSFTRQLASEGTSYNQLFADVQSERARNLLANPNLRVSEVGYRMGYSDPAAFTRAFTAWHGVTPSHWRDGQ